MEILLFDTPLRDRLMPLSLTRATSDIRMGIYTGIERWKKLTGLNVRVVTEPYLSNLYERITPADFLMVDAGVIVTSQLFESLYSLQPGYALLDKNGLIGGRVQRPERPVFGEDFTMLFSHHQQVEEVKRIDLPCRIFQWNAELIRQDFVIATSGKQMALPYNQVQLTGEGNIFIEEGANIGYCMLNATDGPIYIGKGASIMEGCMVRGPFALGEGATLKMGSKIYGGTTIGPECTVGGEIKNAVILGYSNKAHDGYLGDSVIGQWCNLGAGTSNSNVKNSGGEVKHWNYFLKDFIASGNKGGFIMGDYSRTSINTSINTGTVAGVCCNIFGEGLTPKVIPNFTWGTKELTRYEFEKSLTDIEKWKQMKQHSFTPDEKEILKYIFDNYND